MNLALLEKRESFSSRNERRKFFLKMSEKEEVIVQEAKFLHFSGSKQTVSAAKFRPFIAVAVHLSDRPSLAVLKLEQKN